MDSSSGYCCLQGPQENYYSPSAKIYPTHLENISDRQKLAVLTQTFPGIKPTDVKRALNKCRGLVVHTIDVLLDQIILLKESGQKDQRVGFATESKPNSRPRVIIRRKVSKAASSGPRRVHSTTRRLRGNGKLKYCLDRRLSSSSDQPKLALKSSLKKPFIKHSSDKGKRSARDFVNILDVPTAGKPKDGSRDDRKTRSMRRRTDKNKGGGRDKDIGETPKR